MRRKIAAGLAACTLIGGLGLGLDARPAAADPVKILFVGNSYTHGRYTPVLNYNAGPGNAAGSDRVHDLLCPSLPCTGAEGVAAAYPTPANTPGDSVLAQLGYLQANPSKTYTEVGPFGGVAGIFLQLTREAGLDYDVSLIAVSSATLNGYAKNSGNEAGILPLITSAAYRQVVMQDQTFEPLPTSIMVGGKSVPTRGNPVSFNAGLTALVNGIDAADAAAGAPYAAITLAETPPLASYGYLSDNPAAPIFGSSTAAQQNGNPAYAPYLGDSDPMAAMAGDLHAAYESAAATYQAAHPGRSTVQVSPDGDAWITAMNFGVAERDPFLAHEPLGQIDLWDGDPLLACCTVPIGYHPSVYGDYLNALMLFGRITGINPLWVAAEYLPILPQARQSAARALGISSKIAASLAVVASETLIADGPVRQPAGLLCPARNWAECRRLPPWRNFYPGTGRE